MAKVSVVIPAYNAARTLAATLDSVLAQTAPDWEAIVVNDGSRDKTKTIAQQFAAQDPRIRVVTRKNGGESAARNTGIEHATAAWLLFLDADDWIAPEYLQRMAAELEAHPDLDAVICRSVRVAADGTQVSDEYQPPAGDLFPILARRAAFPGNACLVRRAIVEAVGKFDPTLRKSPDWDLWQRVARTGARFGTIPDVLAYYRMQPNSASLAAAQMLRDGLRVLRQGHAADPRVPNPHPDYAHGLTSDRVDTQVFYLLSWCAGLLLGSGQDARELLDQVREYRHETLDASAVAQCLFDSGTLPACQPPDTWDALLLERLPLVCSFLEALEAQSGAPDLAARTMRAFQGLILNRSKVWGPFAEYQTELQHGLELERDHLRQRLQELQGGWMSLEADAGQLRTELAEKQSHQSALQLQSRTLEEQVEHLGLHKRRLEFLAERLASDSRGLESQVERLESDKQGLASQLAQLGSNQQLLEVELEQLTASNRGLESQVEQLESDRQGLASQVAQLGSDKQRVEAELERVAADKRGLESQVERLESDKQGLASQVAQLESDKQRVEAELERVAFDNRGLESQVERLESDKQGLASQVAQLESDKQRVEAELERVAADNRGLKSQVEQLSADRQALEADVARLLTDQAALTEEKRVLSTDLQQALHQIDSFRQDLEAQRHAFAALQNAFVALQNVKESLELDRDSLTEELRKVGRFSHERSAILASLRSRAWIRLGLGLHALQPFDLDDTRFIDEPKSDGSVTWIEQPGGHVQHLSSGKRWQLRVSSGNSARLLVARGDERLLRIDIARAGTKAQWDIQLDQDHLQLEAGAKYRLSFRVRSDAARAMEFGVAQAHEPWDNLGLYQRMAVTPDWATFEQEITPTADDSNGRVHFDLGRYPVSLELADVRFVPVDLESTQSERSRAIPS